MNMMSCSLARASSSAVLTFRLAARSILFPTSTMITSVPRCARTSAIHLVVASNDSRLVMSKTTTATCESRMYDGMSERKRSCPAVSHSCKRTVPSSTGTVFETKSIPIVVW